MKKLIALLLFPSMAWGQILTKQLETVDTSWYFAYPTGEVIHGGELIDIVAGDHIELDFNEINNRLTVKSKQGPIDTFIVDTSFYYRSSHEDEILFLLELYERECYNDSTRAEIWDEEFIATDSIGDAVIGYTQLVGRIKWKHREPTFAGFIKWLKARK